VTTDTGVPPVTTAGRPSAYPDVVAWLEALRDVALLRGHRDAAAHAAKALSIIAAAHRSIESGFNVDPDLLVALLGVPVVGR
jgi:hypothetical protein